MMWLYSLVYNKNLQRFRAVYQRK